MHEKPTAKADCYCGRERAGMARYQRFKDRLLGPLLAIMRRWGLTPAQISLLSTLTGLAFCPLYFWAPACGYAMLLAHLLLDGLDGPLARHGGTASRKGSFTDTVGDQVVVVATMVTWMYARTIGLPGVGVVAGALYVFLYTMVVVFAVVRNAMGVPYVWLFRPRIVVYGWFFLESFCFPGTPLEGTVDYVVWGFNVVLALKFATGFLTIRGRL